MKKFILFFILMFVVFSNTAFAEGEYDGIWNTPIGFISIHENNGMLGAILLQVGNDMTLWTVSAGVLEGNEARFRSIPLTSKDPTTVIDVTFESEDIFSANAVACTPEALCEEFNMIEEQLGWPIQGEKIW